MIRPARESDAEALLELYRPYVENTSITFETEVPSLSEFRGRIASISGFFPYLVLEEAGEILGYAYAHPYHERAAFHWTVETSIYVREDCRGRHVGLRLYRALLGILEAQGVKTACAVITIPNPRSIGFHEALGFHEEGRLHNFGYKLGAWHGVSYLVKQLGPYEQEPRPLVPWQELGLSRIRDIVEPTDEIS